MLLRTCCWPKRYRGSATQRGPRLTGFLRAAVAQVVERSPEKAGVGGSTPSRGTNLITRLGVTQDINISLLIHRSFARFISPPQALPEYCPASHPAQLMAGRRNGRGPNQRSVKGSRRQPCRSIRRGEDLGLEFLLNVAEDLLAVKAAVFDEDFVGIHARDDDAGEINSRHVAFQSFRIALGTMGYGVNFHANIAEEAKIGMVSGERENKIVIQVQDFPALPMDADGAGNNLLHLGLRQGANGAFLDAIFDVGPNPVFEVRTERRAHGKSR